VLYYRKSNIFKNSKQKIMAALTPPGIIHTAINLVAVASGAISLIRHKGISWKNLAGKIYVTATVFTCVTGFGIFQHGGFGKPHVLGIITLLVLGLALAAGKNSRPFGRPSPYIETVACPMTFFFHLVPGITETTTRLPVDKPLASEPDDPYIQGAISVCFLLFLVGATWQILKLRAKLRSGV
jgi:uncharacterized membrane protein